MTARMSFVNLSTYSTVFSLLSDSSESAISWKLDVSIVFENIYNQNIIACHSFLIPPRLVYCHGKNLLCFGCKLFLERHLRDSQDI